MLMDPTNNLGVNSRCGGRHMKENVLLFVAIHVMTVVDALVGVV